MFERRACQRPSARISTGSVGFNQISTIGHRTDVRYSGRGLLRCTHPTPFLVDHPWKGTPMRQPPDVVFAALVAAEPDLMDRDQLAELTATIAALKAWCDALQVRATRRLRVLAEEGRAEAPRDLIAKHGRETGKGARDVADREQVCTLVAELRRRLGGWRCGGGSCRCHLTRHPRPRSAGVGRVQLACRHRCWRMPSGMGSRCSNATAAIWHVSSRAPSRVPPIWTSCNSNAKQSSVKRWTDRESGMRMTLLKLDPVRDAQFWAGVTRIHKTAAPPAWGREAGMG